MLADVPRTILGEEFELLSRFRARLQGAQMRVIGAQEVGQHARVKRVTLGSALPKSVPSPVERFGVHGVDDDAMVQQEIHHAAVGPLDRRPQGDSPGPPLVQLSAPLAQAFRRVRDRAGRDLQSALINNPDGVGLIGPIHSEAVAHSSPSFWPQHSWPRSGNGKVRLIPALVGGHFLLNLWRRSLADQSQREPLGALRGKVLWSASSWPSCFGRLSLSFHLLLSPSQRTRFCGLTEDAP